jgi:hypothetical protein
MLTIYYSSICSDAAGEVEGMFSEDGVLFGMWASNDANWRNEYFSGFMKAIGVVVDTSGKFDDLLERLAIEQWG